MKDSRGMRKFMYRIHACVKLSTKNFINEKESQNIKHKDSHCQVRQMAQGYFTMSWL